MTTKTDKRIIADNRRARYDYFIEETLEAGIVLVGTEVKSLRAGKANVAESHADFDGEILVLHNAYIPEYQKASQYFNHSARRPRKLLLHKSELKKLFGKVKQKGYTLVPLNLYFNAKNIVKLELGLAKGKKKHDKRETEKNRDWARDKARAMKEG
jgi:SsrA-binding protein